MKKQKPIEIREDPGLKARRQARAAVGAVKPSYAITPKAGRPLKHKKKFEEEEAR